MIKRGRKAIYSFKNMTKTIISPISDPWIYQHEWLGLITVSSDGINWLTIADKNLGATQSYNLGEELTQANCGNFYQWWNCYWFPFSWPTQFSDNKVDTSEYWPDNYYSSDIWIRQYVSRQIQDNEDLWWNITNTNEARRGPCWEWFHIPSLSELSQLEYLCYYLNIGTRVWNSWKTIEKYFKMPFAWTIDILWSKYKLGERGFYAATWIVLEEWNYRAEYLRIENPLSTVWASRRQCEGFSIRPFKNEPVQPDTSRTVLYQPS